MHQGIDDVRATLGELAAMAAQCDEAERQILARATERLVRVEQLIEPARVAALVGGDAQRMAYEALIAEHGTLQQVIARSKQILDAG